MWLFRRVCLPISPSQSVPLTTLHHPVLTGHRSLAHVFSIHPRCTTCAHHNKLCTGCTFPNEALCLHSQIKLNEYSKCIHSAEWRMCEWMRMINGCRYFYGMLSLSRMQAATSIGCGHINMTSAKSSAPRDHLWRFFSWKVKTITQQARRGQS